MALSNWDTLVIDETGKAINGVFKSPLGIEVEFYKNWLYIHDKKAWEEGGAFVEDTVMEVQSGCFRYKDTNVLAFRGPQNGVFAIVWNTTYEKGKDAKTTGMVGCGVYGYDDSGEFIGVIPETKRWFVACLKETEVVKIEGAGEGGKTMEYESSVLDFPEEFKKLDWEQALRFNQGDAYFAARLGHEIPATEVGKPEPTIMSGIIKNMKTDT